MTPIALFVLALVAPPPESPARLRVDPLLLAEAEAVWQVIARDENPVWPGWNASDTPILVYIPGIQDVLVNHPKPPSGFAPCDGPHEFLGSREAIVVKDGPTLVEWDGQNTSREVNGVETLVVADTLSNRKQTLRGLLEDPRPPEAILADLDYERDIGTDPYAQMSMIAHEAFHVFQARRAPGKGADERHVRVYPCLSVENNVGFALEGDALAECLRASDAAAARAAAVRFLAVRLERRKGLPPEAIAYEDGNEFAEGLAMYVELALPRELEKTRPADELRWAQGFHGFADLGFLRERRLEGLVRNMRGEVNVNNDPYGTSPLRGRLYFSGMAIAALLDRLGAPDWKTRVFEAGTTLTSLAAEAIGATPRELEAALGAARSGPEYARLVASKTRLENEGRLDTARRVEAIEKGASESTPVLIDFSALGSPKIGLSFTGYGVRMVDAERTVYTLVPIEARMGSDADAFEQSIPLATLEDRNAKTFRFALPESLSAARLAELLGQPSAPKHAISGLDLALPGVRLRARRAEIEHRGDSVLVRYLPAN